MCRWPCRWWQSVVLVVMAVYLVQAAMIQKRRKTALVEGDILIGALFSVHHQPKQKSAFTLTCGEIREQYGIQRVEAAFMAIDKINEDPRLLPNITLGVEIRDSCWYSSIALEQSIEFIRDSLAFPIGSSTNSTPKSDACKTSVSTSKRLVGVVGPGSSDVTIQVQNLLQLFGIPQVGYSATSRDLSDKSRFSYFMRVVPSDYYQAQVMVDIVRHYNWTYVSAVHTDGNYGQSGMTAFRELAEGNNICIAKEDSVLSNAEDEAFDMVIEQLREDQRANVVVCFCEGMTVRNLLLAAQRNNVTSRFLFIGSDGWADRSDVVAGLEEAAVGGLSIKINSSYVSEFDDHYFQLHPEKNDRNPWFREFWQMRFNCSLPGQEENSKLPGCSGMESLRKGYKQDTKMAFVMKAIYTMAWGLHNMQKDLCPSTQGLCDAMLPVNGSLYRDYLMNVTFTYNNESVTFDSRGDPPGRYDIMNYQRLENGSFDYIPVGTWDNGTLVVHEELVIFNSSDGLPPISVCSEPCSYNEYKSFVETGDDTQRCCWICTPCDRDEYLKNETVCQRCQPGYWPNLNKTGCDAIPVKHIMWSDAESIVALSLASLGFLATCFTMLVFLKYNHTPVVKASTRELSYIIFVGMMVSYSATLPLLARPSGLSCVVSASPSIFAGSPALVKLVCNTSPRGIIAPMGWDFFLIAMCTVYAIKTRNLPENFNEAKFIGFSMYTTCVIWMAWVPIYFGSDHKIICMSMCTSLSALVTLVLLFFPKLYIILFRPEKNDRSAFKTATTVRCHIGSSSKASLSRPSEPSPSAAMESMYVGSAMLGIGQPHLSLLQRIRSTLGMPFIPPLGLLPRDPYPRSLLRREISVWSDASGSVGTGGVTSNTRDMMLRKAYGSQLDLAGGDGVWCREERGCQTTDDLLDPLIPRLRRRVARAVRENEIDVSEGREFFSITHNWMNSQAEAARHAKTTEKQRNGSDDRPPITTIVREDTAMPQDKELKVKEPVTSVKELGSEIAGSPSGTDPGRDSTGEPITYGGEIKCSYLTSQYYSSGEPKQPPSDAENAMQQSRITATSVTEEDEVTVADQNEETNYKFCSQRSPLRQESDMCNHNVSTVNNVQDSQFSSESNLLPRLFGCSDSRSEFSVHRQNMTDSQVVNFVGYGSVMPCSEDSTWTKPRSVSCDNGIIFNNRVVPFSQGTQTEMALEKQGWVSNTDCRNLVDTTSDTNEKMDLYHRRRKAGVSAKVSNIRGILKSVRLSPSEKESRVSFGSQFSPSTRVTTEDELLSPSIVDEDSQTYFQDGLRHQHQTMAYDNLCMQKHSAAEEATFSILEEALSSESDTEASDNCELKTIIIRLGSDEVDFAKAQTTRSEVNGNIINWRPKLGKNHTFLPYTSLNYSYDNPSVNTDTEVLCNIQDVPDTEDPDNSETLPKEQQGDEEPGKKYSVDNELVILNLLHSTLPPKYPNIQESHPNTISITSKTSSVDVPSFSDQVTSEDSASMSSKCLTITPPELYRNYPPKQHSPPQEPLTHCLPHTSLQTSPHKSPPSRSVTETAILTHVTTHTLRPVVQEYCSAELTELKCPSSNSSNLSPTPSNLPSTLSILSSTTTSALQKPSSASHLPTTKTKCITSGEAPVCVNSSLSSERVPTPQSTGAEEDRLTDLRLCRTDTDDDTDESTTPIKEFFRIHGIKFDVTSTKSKKL
nr:uncharacterized protein LOC128701648 [Cherax quadricarinatus]